ncbi:hypothetical protein EFP68_01375 [Lactobacillus helveticus]|uniref:hypothetical protein n=1 Tax=Lactobacillus helveticus TaxID=1587 RepID=UPI001C1E752C|nr:hypothetical protein [Lactobacillus helveticus]MBU5980054.1 hypothetical protein [Lactobacillus helveticus]MCT3413396.1 hypothetical protein [Lactobacillus helveticus]
MELTNYQRALLIIHELEKRFGSITKVPDSNHKMREIHRLLPMDRPSKDVNYERVRLLNRKGYSIAHIAQVTHHNKAAISKYLSTYNLKPKRAFKYRVKSNSSKIAYYSTSLINLASLLLHKDINDNATAESELNMHGFSVKTSFYIWYQIPDGDYYCLPYLKKLAIKQGIDSYIYPDEYQL